MTVFVETTIDLQIPVIVCAQHRLITFFKTFNKRGEIIFYNLFICIIINKV